jgi:cell wall-associated NlpC family hydrolase
MRVRVRGIATIGIAGLALAGCGSSQSTTASDGGHLNGPSLPNSPALHAHPQVVQPVAGEGAAQTGGPGSGSVAPAAVSVGPAKGPLAQPVSDAEIRHELAASGLSADAHRATLTSDGLAIAPINAPLQVQEIIQAGNQIAHLPYVWGGGHGTFVDTGYDCSGSISFVFAAAGILKTTMVSGELANWGAPGPGKWITVFANNGHTFMYVAGLRFDTVALAETGTRWSNRPADEPDLASFSVRHPPGL